MMDGLIENRKFIYGKHPLLTQFNKLTDEAATTIPSDKAEAAIEVLDQIKRAVEAKQNLILTHKDFFIQCQKLERAICELKKQRDVIISNRVNLLDDLNKFEGLVGLYTMGGIFTVGGILTLSLGAVLSVSLGVGIPFLIIGLAIIAGAVIFQIQDKRKEKKEAESMENQIDDLGKAMNEKLSEMAMLCREKAAPEASENVGLSSLPFFSTNDDELKEQPMEHAVIRNP